MFTIVTFYKFKRNKDLKHLREQILNQCLKLDLRGTILLAEEGINGTISGTDTAIKKILNYLGSDEMFGELECKYSYEDEVPFYRMKVKLKKEIITFGTDKADPNQRAGEYVEPERWNEVIADPEVLVVDTRNDYEVGIGTFRGAIDPKTKSFTEFAEFVDKNLDPKKHKKVAMFCTGGIRCEKASSFMLKEGFEKVYHLKGGILKYLEEVPKEQSMWEGECFVFDRRTSVKTGLEKGEYELCSNCRHPVSPEERKSEKFELGVSCPNCHDSLTPERISSLRERQKQIELAEKRGSTHLGWGKPYSKCY